MKPTAAQLAKFHADNGWRSGAERRALRQPRRRMMERVVARLSCYHGDEIVCGGWMMDLPLYVLALQDNGTRYARGDNATSAENQRAAIWDVCLRQLASVERERIVALEFERHTTDAKGLEVHDNLPASMKHAVDALCAWVFEGPYVAHPKVLRRLGKYDDRFLREGGQIWNDRQQLSQPAHGVRIKVHLGGSRSPTRAR